MAINMRVDMRVVFRALAISLLLHAWLLLQTPPPVSLPPRVLIDAELRRGTDMTMTTQERAASPTAPLPRSNMQPTHAAKAAANAPARDIALPVTESEFAPMEFNATEARKSYVFMLVREARRIKRAALPAGWESLRGTSEIRISIDANGIEQASLQNSSGDARTDDAALKLVAAALTNTLVPSDLRGEAFDLVLPLSFGD